MEIAIIELSEEHIAMLKADRESVEWCECDHEGSHYVSDTPEMKHHWRCNHCNKVTQIG